MRKEDINIGRYYYTDSGREGKFMFGVQPSDDPQYMGMSEDPSYIEYYADDNDEPKIREQLDKQYDILGVPKDKRIYYAKTPEDYDKFERDELEDKVWVKVKDGSEEEKKFEGKTKWWCEDKGYTMYERENMALVLARIRLGINILSDIKDDGSCYLRAET